MAQGEVALGLSASAVDPEALLIISGQVLSPLINKIFLDPSLAEETIDLVVVAPDRVTSSTYRMMINKTFGRPDLENGHAHKELIYPL